MSSQFFVLVFDDFYDGPLNGFIVSGGFQEVGFFRKTWAGPSMKLRLLEMRTLPPSAEMRRSSNPIIRSLLRHVDLGESTPEPVHAGQFCDEEEFWSAAELFDRSDARVRYLFGTGFEDFIARDESSE